MDKMLVLDVS
jgi:hypothetical protein